MISSQSTNNMMLVLPFEQQGSSASIDDRSCSSLTGEDSSSISKPEDGWNSLSSSVNFPSKLHHLLEMAQSEGYDHIISWEPNGRGFKIHDRPKFVSTILPRYISHIKYKSFLRQLNLYNFKRISRGAGRGIYYHEQMIRGDTELCHYMSRAKSTQSGTSKSTSSAPKKRKSSEVRKDPDVPKPTEDTSDSRGEDGKTFEPVSLEEMVEAGRRTTIMSMPSDVEEAFMNLFVDVTPRPTPPAPFGPTPTQNTGAPSPSEDMMDLLEDLVDTTRYDETSKALDDFTLSPCLYEI